VKSTHNVVLQMLSDTRQLYVNRNVHCLKHVFRADPAQHQHLRTADRAACQDDLLRDIDRARLCAACRSKLDGARSKIPLRRVGREYDACDGRIGENG
jgi:hypothetical protein